MSAPRVLVFSLWCVLCGVLTSLVWHFLPWHLAHLASTHTGQCSTFIAPCIHLYNSSLYTVSLAGEAGAGDPCQPRPPAQWLTLLLGLNMGVQCFLGEVPMFFISGWLLRSVQRSS